MFFGVWKFGSEMSKQTATLTIAQDAYTSSQQTYSCPALQQPSCAVSPFLSTTFGLAPLLIRYLIARLGQAKRIPESHRAKPKVPGDWNRLGTLKQVGRMRCWESCPQSTSKTLNVCPGSWTSWTFVWTDPAWWYSHVPDGQRKRGRFDLTPWCPDSRRRGQSDRMQQQQLTEPRARDESQLGGYFFTRIFTLTCKLQEKTMILTKKGNGVQTWWWKMRNIHDGASDGDGDGNCDDEMMTIQIIMVMMGMMVMMVMVAAVVAMKRRRRSVRGGRGKRRKRRQRTQKNWRGGRGKEEDYLFWLIAWLLDWQIDWLTDWLIDWLIDWFIYGKLIYGYIGIYWYNGKLVHWYTD